MDISRGMYFYIFIWVKKASTCTLIKTVETNMEARGIPTGQAWSKESSTLVLAVDYTHFIYFLGFVKKHGALQEWIPNWKQIIFSLKFRYWFSKASVFSWDAWKIATIPDKPHKLPQAARLSATQWAWIQENWEAKTVSIWESSRLNIKINYTNLCELSMNWIMA